MTKEERYALFQRKSAEGKRRNDAAIKTANLYEEQIKAGKMTVGDALCFAFAEGFDYAHKNMVEVGEANIVWVEDNGRAFPELDDCVNDMLMPSVISTNFNDGDKVKIYLFKED